LSALAMTGKTGSGTLFESLRFSQRCDEGKRQSRNYFTHRPVLATTIQG
jgi:hypothetical protein